MKNVQKIFTVTPFVGIGPVTDVFLSDMERCVTVEIHIDYVKRQCIIRELFTLTFELIYSLTRVKVKRSIRKADL